MRNAGELNQQAEVYLKPGKIEQAIAVCHEALKIYPTSRKPFSKLATLSHF